jgi:hypothetical protein
MIWWFTARSHGASISPWVRNWIRSSKINRLIILLPFVVAWITAWTVAAILAKSTAVPVLVMATVPFIFWVLEFFLDGRITGGEIRKMMTQKDVVLATRAEYIGGHPRLPHGRFVYLTLSGTRENPILTIVFPTDTPPDENFEIPLLDIDKHEPKAEEAESPAADLLAVLSEKPGKMFAEERVTLNVRYQGLAGRKHIVEFSSFFHGGDEVRNWRNYLVCAQAEADTGVTPRQPWKSLDPDPALAHTVALEEVAHGSRNGTGNGSTAEGSPSRSAFERR